MYFYKYCLKNYDHEVDKILKLNICILLFLFDYGDITIFLFHQDHLDKLAHYLSN